MNGKLFFGLFSELCITIFGIQNHKQKYCIVSINKKFVALVCENKKTELLCSD